MAAEWQTAVDAWRAANPDRAAAYDALFAKNVDVAEFPEFELGAKLATRQASGKVLNAIAADLPVLFGGSADLSESNQTLLHHEASVSAENFLGRNVHFGIREHAMGAMLNGFALYGFHAYGGTFLVFSDYMRGAVRLSALMKTAVTYVWTHDSIGLGEDGPTHQPVEHLWSLRALPDFAVVRPADANETAAAWKHLIASAQPAGLILSRQAIATVTTAQQAAQVAKGAYVLRDADAATAILVATGSEVGMALAAADALAADGIAVRVVSAPCLEWFDAQPAEYRESVLPAAITNRVSIEAGATQGWYKYVSTPIGLDHFGASGDPNLLYKTFGISVDAVVAAVKAHA